MNIQLNTQGYQQNQVGNVSEQPINDIATLKQELQLATGQILSGRVTQLDGNSITLLLGDNRSVSAQLAGDLNVNVGQVLSFEVKSNVNHTTELRPLYTNLSNQSTIANALSEASLPATDRNISMVQNMMEEGMAVNKQALLDMVSGLNSHPDVSVETLVRMQKLDLPLNETTIQQFQNYENFQHQIIKDVMDLTDGLSGIPQEIFETSDENTALNTASEILKMALPQAEEVVSEQVMTTPQPEQGDARPVSENPVFDQIMELKDTLSELTSLIDSHQPQEAVEGSSNKLLQAAFQILSDPEKINNLPQSAKQAVKDVLTNDTFKQVLSTKLSEQFTLKPEDVAKEGKVEELYRRILENTSKALELAENTTGNPTTIRAAQNLNDNVTFMNQINEMMAYVQLPLKMSEENAHGDLYVYTNKKKLAEKDGDYSALLHLDMDYLGPMDVYVKLNQQKVSTHFYMQDEDTLSFIEANIHLLSERLNRKGYQMSSSVSVKETSEMKSMAEAFLTSDEEATPPPILSSFSFDVRA